MSEKIFASVNRNLVAIISLLVAITALTISVDRANRSEYQHNIRDASFRVLAELSALQLLVDNAHYHHEPVNPIVGWARVNYMQDLSAVIPAPVPEALDTLFQRWQQHVNQLGVKEDSASQQASLVANQQISEAIAESRAALREMLRSLE